MKVEVGRSGKRGSETARPIAFVFTALTSSCLLNPPQLIAMLNSLRSVSCMDAIVVDLKVARSRV